MRFTITRSKWLRGRGNENSVLLREDGKQCCIGQVASQCGAPDSLLLDEPDVEHIFCNDESAVPPALLAGDHVLDWFSEAYRINDERAEDDAERESKLSALAAANGHEFVFVD